MQSSVTVQPLPDQILNQLNMNWLSQYIMISIFQRLENSNQKNSAQKQLIISQLYLFSHQIGFLQFAHLYFCIRQTIMQQNQLSDDSSSFSIGLVPITANIKSKKTIISDHKPVSQKIDQLDDKLIASISIISPVCIQAFECRKPLKNYRYSRKKSEFSMLNNYSVAQEIQRQQIFNTLKDLFSEFRQNIKNKLYIVQNNGDLMYFKHKPQENNLKTGHKNGGSFLIVCSRRSSYKKMIKQYEIPFEEINKQQFQIERLLFKGNAVTLFWNWFTQETLNKDLSYEIVSNFYFLNCGQILPLQTFSGKQHRQQYLYLSVQKQNIVEEKIVQLHNTKLQGLWFKQNIKSLSQSISAKLEKHKYTLEFEIHPCTETLAQNMKEL